MDDEVRNPAPTPPAPDAASVAAGDAQEAQEGLLPDVEGETALAEAEDAQAPTVSHIRSAIFRSGDRRLVHGGELIVKSVRLDGRTQRALRLRCERVARDKGFERFEDAPAIMQGEIESYCRLQLALDLMWANFIASLIGTGQGHLPDAFLDYENAKHRKAMHLGLKRELRDAKALDIAAELASMRSDGEQT